MAPASTYHHFAVGMTGDKMSSSQPKTTLFLRDDLAAVEKKIKRAFRRSANRGRASPVRWKSGH